LGRPSAYGAGDEYDYDLVVLGAGSAAFAAAIRARDLGRRVLPSRSGPSAARA
jgi:predicted flavoprotein YhiN